MERDRSQPERNLEKTVSALFEISNAAFQTRDLTAFYQVTQKALAAILPADHFFVALCEPGGDSIWFPYVAGRPDPDRLSSPRPVPQVISRVIRAQKTLVLKGRETLGLAQCLGAWPGEACILAPLMVKGQVKGVMGIETRDVPVPTQDLVLLNSVSQHLALAIERKEAEANILGQRQILEQILESSPVGIALVQNRVFKWVNTEMVRMFGYRSKEDFQDQSVKMIYEAAEDFDWAGRTIFEGLSARGRVDYEMDLKRSDNTLFPVHVQLNANDSKDPMSWIIGTFTDISQRKTAEKESFERERLQGVLEMAGAICHEINQPLQAILGYAELLEMDPNSPMAASNLLSIKNQANRLGKITATLANITQYRTIEYPGQTKIVDIWGAGVPEFKT